MPKSVVLTCLSPEAKDMLESNLKSLDRGTRQVFQQIIETVADCDENQFIGVEIHESEPATGQRKKRKPSPFNNFIAECAKGGAKPLAECAKLWMRKTDAEKESYRTVVGNQAVRTGSGSSHNPGEKKY